MSAHGQTEMQVKEYIRQFHSVHLADIIIHTNIKLHKRLSVHANHNEGE